MAPDLFEASLCLSGVGPDDGWFFVNVEFLIEVGGDVATLRGTCNRLVSLDYTYLAQNSLGYPKES